MSDPSPRLRHATGAIVLYLVLIACVAATIGSAVFGATYAEYRLECSLIVVAGAAAAGMRSNARGSVLTLMPAVVGLTAAAFEQTTVHGSGAGGFAQLRASFERLNLAAVALTCAAVASHAPEVFRRVRSDARGPRAHFLLDIALLATAALGAFMMSLWLLVPIALVTLVVVRVPGDVLPLLVSRRSWCLATATIILVGALQMAWSEIAACADDSCACFGAASSSLFGRVAFSVLFALVSLALPDGNEPDPPPSAAS